MWFIDTETFKYDWMMVGVNMNGPDPSKFDKVEIVNDKDALIKFYNENKNDIWVMYNGANYDQYIIKGIMLGFNPKEINDFIIIEGHKGWEFSRLFNTIPLIVYDAMPVPPVGLKTLEGFMGKNIHETSVPFDIDRKLSKREIKETLSYCTNDVMEMIEVFLRKSSEFEAQISLIRQFNLPYSDLVKTQAQLAAKILDAKRVKTNDEWEIRLPDNLQLGKYQHIGDWFLSDEAHDYKSKLQCNVGGIPTTIAWGGGHGAIKQFQYTCKDDEVIVDADVGQLYPNLMIVYDLLSRAVKDKSKFSNILDTSMRLKAEGKKKEREPYKRICNIVYGACGDKYNPMYDPLHRNLVCVYGQVLLIDLIDKIENFVRLFNFNTDGIFFICKKNRLDKVYSIIHDWEDRTGLKMAYDFYTGIYQKDVNNYVAVGEENHRKGGYVKNLNDLDYDLPIVNEAMVNYILDNIPVEKTVYECNDYKKFQKIVKLSSKYDWVELEKDLKRYTYVDRVYKNGRKKIKEEVKVGTYKKFDNKAYRVFASMDETDGRLLKCKKTENGVTKKDKFANTPDHCFIDNGDINNKSIPSKLDRDYYVKLAKKRLEQFGVN